MPKDVDHLLSPEDWRRLGIDDVQALSGGHQSRVFAGRLDGQRVVAKLTNAEYVDKHPITARIQMLEALAQIDASVVAPTGLEDQPLHLAGWLVVVFPFAEGEPPDISQSTDVALMGRTLARLHRSLGLMQPIDVGQVAALEVGTPLMPGSAPQLLHGDFSTSNLRRHGGKLSVFDFDGCGYGPIEFDVANTLYMELFDAVMTNRIDRYRTFRTWFVDAYVSESGIDIHDDTLDAMIAVRRDALGYWIEHLDQAPTGIRISSPEWLGQLRRFVDQF